MMGWVTKSQCPRWAGAAACLFGLGCGSSESKAPLFEMPAAPAEPVVTPLTPEQQAAAEMMMEANATPSEETPAPEDTPEAMPTKPTGSETDPVTEPPPDDEPLGCSPANGVSGKPANISEALILINTLPKPVTLACFIEALDRPLT